MSAPTTFPLPEQLSASEKSKANSLFFVGLVVGGIGSAIGAFYDPAQFAYSWLWAFFCYFPLVSGAVYWILLHYICDSNWSVGVRRIFENLAGCTVVLGVLFLVLILFPQTREVLWKWFTPEAHLSASYQAKSGYLSPLFFSGRALLYFLFIALVAAYYRQHSIWQDVTGSPVHWYRLRNGCYFLMVCWALVQTFAGFDWLMGLDFKWSSSLFGVYTFAFSAQGSLAAGIVLLGFLRLHGHLLFLHHEHFQLMGKLLFGFTIFWAYITFGQYLLIWYANIPEETIFYNDHNRGSWQAVTWLIIVGKFIFPVVFLLAQETKRNFKSLWCLSLWIVFMHFVEMYWLILPYHHEQQATFSLLDLSSWVTVTSAVGLAYICQTSQAVLYPLKDPRLPDCLKITN